MNRIAAWESTTNDSAAGWSGALPKPLKLLLAEELRAGNSIEQITARGRAADTVLLVLLERPFLRKPGALPNEVHIRQTTALDASPAEYYTENPPCVLAAKAA